MSSRCLIIKKFISKTNKIEFYLKRKSPFKTNQSQTPNSCRRKSISRSTMSITSVSLCRFSSILWPNLRRISLNWNCSSRISKIFCNILERLSITPLNPPAMTRVSNTQLNLPCMTMRMSRYQCLITSRVGNNLYSTSTEK